MGFPAVYCCVILPPPLSSLLHLLKCFSRSCALPAAALLFFSGAGADDYLALAPPPPSLLQLSGAACARVDRIMNRLPVVRFAGSGEDAASCCAVCLGEVEEGEEVRQLCNCSHAFHRPCIDRWVDMGQLTCPLCRSCL